MRLFGWPAAMASRVALSQAYGSTPFNLAVWMGCSSRMENLSH